jgi:hypothetical protein
VTYILSDVADVPASNTSAGKTSSEKIAAANGSTFWQRLYAAMIQSRQRSALRELRARSFMIAEAEIVLGGFPHTKLSDDASLPFNR